jgi:hypothetical protein
MDYERGSFRKHEELKTRILTHPELIGVRKKNIISVETEYPLTKRKRAIAKPDIVISYRDHLGVHRMFIEVKSGSCRRALEDLQMQMRKISKYLKNKKMHGEVVGVYPVGNTLTTLIL